MATATAFQTPLLYGKNISFQEWSFRVAHRRATGLMVGSTDPPLHIFRPVEPQVCNTLHSGSGGTFYWRDGIPCPAVCVLLVSIIVHQSQLVPVEARDHSQEEDGKLGRSRHGMSPAVSLRGSRSASLHALILLCPIKLCTEVETLARYASFVMVGRRYPWFLYLLPDAVGLGF